MLILSLASNVAESRAVDIPFSLASREPQKPTDTRWSNSTLPRHSQKHRSRFPECVSKTFWIIGIDD